MVEIKVYVIKLGEYDKIREALPKMDNKLLNHPKSQRPNGLEVHHVGETNASFLYDGQNIVTIGGTFESIDKTKSRLEEISGIKLEEVK